MASPAQWPEMMVTEARGVSQNELIFHDFPMIFPLYGFFLDFFVFLMFFWCFQGVVDTKLREGESLLQVGHVPLHLMQRLAAAGAGQDLRGGTGG